MSFLAVGLLKCKSLGSEHLSIAWQKLEAQYISYITEEGKVISSTYELCFSGAMHAG